MNIPKITICLGSSCFIRGNSKNLEIAENFIKEHGLTDEVDIDLSGDLCTGNCSDGPIVTINGQIYKNVDTVAMNEILNTLFPKQKEIQK